MKKQFDYADMTWERKEGRQETTLCLKRGQSAPDPGCTSCRFWGPATYIFTRWDDGGVDVRRVK